MLMTNNHDSLYTFSEERNLTTLLASLLTVMLMLRGICLISLLQSLTTFSEKIIVRQGVLKTLSYIYDGVFWGKSEWRKAVNYFFKENYFTTDV